MQATRERRPGAAKSSPRRRLPGVVVVLLTVVVLGAPPVAADEHVATVREIDGRAFAYLPGSPTRTLATGDWIEEGTKLVTGKNASMTLVFTDETELALGGGSIVNIDQYRYRASRSGDDDDDDAEPVFTTSIFAGVVRTVTGLIAKARPRTVRFRTTVATIGIRGTHFTAEVQGSSATIILLAQAAADQSNAIEVSNQYGTVEIDKAGWGTEIPNATSPPSPPRKMATSTNMNRILRSVNTTRRVRIPRSPMR